jgi:pimeloyl-ACP methyl ester carboxylesterase
VRRSIESIVREDEKKIERSLAPGDSRACGAPGTDAPFYEGAEGGPTREGAAMDLQVLTLHDQRVTYRTAGEGPVLLLIHGMAGSATTWKHVMPSLSKRFTVVAPDLLGHGRSDKPAGDYSLGAFASMLRDLLVALGHARATVVGQSLGGGVALQFAYQYPERCERLVLVGAGGLGREVHRLLQLLSLPGSGAVLSLACADPIHRTVRRVGDLAARVGLLPVPIVAELWRSYASLADEDARRAFLRTLRAVIEPRGQAVSAANRLHLAAEIPTLIVWGDADSIIPVEHAHAAHDAIPGSQLEIFEGIGHYPHCEAPERFVDVLSEFIESTIPAQISVSQRHVLRSTRS